MKKQVLLIGGGESFRDLDQARNYFFNFDIDRKNEKSWKDWLVWTLEDTHEIFKVNMLDRVNANYELWKIIFEKYLAKINTESVDIITHSLGTIFIMKYLMENKFPTLISNLHLVSPLVANEFQKNNDSEDTATFTFDYKNVDRLASLAKQIHIWHSTDDDICDYRNAEYLQEKLSGVIMHKFENKGHFLQSTFWELAEVMKKDL